jgi:hypothetical protein
MAKEVRLKMTLDEKGAVTSIDKIGGGFKRTRTSGKAAGKAGHAGFLQIAAGAAIALGAIQLVQGGYRAMKNLVRGAITETANLQDETAKLSHMIGVSTSTLSAYRLATELSGTTMQALAVGLRTVSKNSYDVSQGTGEAKLAFEELGVSVTDNNGKLKDAEELLLEVSDKLMLLDESSRRTAIAQKIFGRSGTELLPMMEKGRAGIEALKEEARALGMTFTDETAQASEEYNDSITRLNGALSGMKMKIGNEVIPVLTDMADWIVENESLMADLTAAAKGFGTGIVNSVQLIATALEQWYGTVVPFWEKTKFLTSTGLDTIKNMSTQGPFRGFASSVLGLGPAVEEHEAALASAQKTATVFGNIALQIEKAQLEANSGTKEKIKSNRELGDSFNDLGNDIKKVISLEDQWNNALLASSHHEWVDVQANKAPGASFESLFVNSDAAKEAAQKRQEELEQLSSGFGSAGLLGNVPGVQTGSDVVPEALSDLSVQKTVGALDLMKDAAMGFGQAGAQAFGQWANGSASLGVALRQATTQVLANLAAQAFGNALMQTAYGLARLAFGDVPGATKHFTAAAQFGVVAGIAGVAGRAMSGGSGGMGAQGSAFNPTYVQPSASYGSQQIYSDQAEVFIEIKDTLQRINSISTDEILRMGVARTGGVTPLMNDNDRSVISGEVLQSRFAR